MVKPLSMVLAGIGVLVAIMIYNPKAEESIDNSVYYTHSYVDPETEKDWDYFKGSSFQLIRRTLADGYITYEVTYDGTQIGKDVVSLYSELAETHNTEIKILVQSNTNSEVITYVCEDGKVAKYQ